jgi:hypothetical protein
MTLGILHDPWPALRGRGPRRYRTMVEFKANPRDEHYLRELFAERHPGGRIGGLDEVTQAEGVVLLYPDAIGIGWSSVEREVRRRMRPGAELRVLNGRRRDFALDRAMRRRLAVRRAFETAVLGEALFTALFLLATPPLLAWDLLRGRR